MVRDCRKDIMVPNGVVEGKIVGIISVDKELIVKCRQGEKIKSSPVDSASKRLSSASGDGVNGDMAS